MQASIGPLMTALNVGAGVCRWHRAIPVAVKPMPVSSMVINDIRLDVHQSALSLKVV
jgi:hypothetical protein